MTGVLLAKFGHVAIIEFILSRLQPLKLLWVCIKSPSLLGIVIFVSSEFPLNTLLPRLVTLLGIVMEVRAEQSKKVKSGSAVTPLPMSTEVR